MRVNATANTAVMITTTTVTLLRYSNKKRRYASIQRCGIIALNLRFRRACS